MSSCFAWTRERQAFSPRAEEMASWVRGYISGANSIAGTPDFLIFAPDPVEALNSNIAISWIDSYCKSHPRESIVAGASAFVNELRSRAAK